MQPETSSIIASPVIDVGGAPYMRDAKGALIPLALVKPADKLQDETVRKVMRFAAELSEQIARFKAHTFADLYGFQELLQQEYGGKAGGSKGNVTFMTIDGLMKVQIQIADQISFGPQLQEAKKLIDECLLEWGASSRPEIQALVAKAFSVEKEGQINKAELFMMMRLDIEDSRWMKAMDAIRDAIRVVGTKEYVRFYRRAKATDPFQPVTIDLAAA
ncbi:MAG: DUF3164 family protein [Bosea sp.]|jgi:hypothetical protein|nr:DUF3164 family protein [Bosea sp. (in: a-proteobacteria)]